MKSTDTRVTAQAFEIYYRHASIEPNEPGMAGGCLGRRFLTNGHFMFMVSEEVYTSALAESWRNVTTTDAWSGIVRLGFGRRIETVKLPAMTVDDEDGYVALGSACIKSAYVDLLRVLEVCEVDIVHDRPGSFAIANDVCIISAIEGGGS